MEQQRDLFVTAEDDLNNQFLETQKSEATFVRSLQEKYGDGSLDLENELFIPNPEN